MFQQLEKSSALESFFQAYAKKLEAVFVSFLKAMSNFAQNSEVADLSISMTVDTCVIGTCTQVKTWAVSFQKEDNF